MLQESFHDETVEKIAELYKFDCLRANKSTMAWGLEARVPFLDRDFMALAMAIDPAEKMIDKSKGAAPLLIRSTWPALRCSAPHPWFIVQSWIVRAACTRAPAEPPVTLQASRTLCLVACPNRVLLQNWRNNQLPPASSIPPSQRP